jgi:hypothetical protein
MQIYWNKCYESLGCLLVAGDIFNHFFIRVRHFNYVRQV